MRGVDRCNPAGEPDSVGGLKTAHLDLTRAFRSRSGNFSIEAAEVIVGILLPGHD